MTKYAFLIFLSVFFALATSFDVSAQIQNIPETPPVKVAGSDLDSLRKKEENALDSVVYTAKYIQFTTNDLLKDSIQTLAIDTTLNNYQNYNPLYQPYRPTINLGNIGLAYREMLFNPRKNIGFDAGFHSLDIYLLRQDSIKYYQARSPYTQLYYVNGSTTEQVFKVTHSQNIKPNWNFAVNYNRITAEGFYQNQKSDHTNVALSTWYQSPGKHYNLLANGIINTLKAGENGSVIKDTLFSAGNSIPHEAEFVRLSAPDANRPKQTWREKTIYLKQFFYIGRIDTTGNDTVSRILPTQRVSYTVSYTTNQYNFFKNEPDTAGAFPKGMISDTTSLTADTTSIKNLRNEFMYSFYLRGKATKFIKNELKLDVGIQHDYYWYQQTASKIKFQNVTLKAEPGYRFSDKVTLTGNLQQIIQGRNAGDFIYQANSNILLGKSVGRIVLSAYLQNKSPEQIYENVNYQFHKWDLNFDRTKTTNVSFQYQNPKYRFNAKAEYYLITNYLYFQETAVSNQILPTQAPNGINLLKLSVGKDLRFGKFNMQNYVVYQKTDDNSILRTPEFYTYNSLYFASTFFKVLYTNFGVDVRYNSRFETQSYAINVGQFYNGQAVKFESYPVVDVWVKATLKRASLFVKYDYANQGLFSKGYYTVNRYPMADALLKFGVRWNFYD